MSVLGLIFWCCVIAIIPVIAWGQINDIKAWNISYTFWLNRKGVEWSDADRMAAAYPWWVKLNTDPREEAALDYAVIVDD